MKPASARSADAGFTLIEVVVAISLIGGALLTVLAAATSGFAYQNMARQRQTATALANQVLEQVRGSNYNEVGKGVLIASGDAHAVSCGSGSKAATRLIACAPVVGQAGTGERVQVNPAASVAPFGPNHGTVTVDGQNYTWWLYISRATTGPWRATVFVDWPWQGKTYSTSMQTLVWARPDRCLGSGQNPVSLPCASGTAYTVTTAGLTVSLSSGSAVASAAIGSASVRIADAQTARLWASTNYPSSPVPGSLLADVSSDANSGLPSQTGTLNANEISTQTLSSATISGASCGAGCTANWDLRVRYLPLASDSYYSTSTAIAGITIPGQVGSCGVYASGAPCAYGDVSGGKTLVLQLACVTPSACGGSSGIFGSLASTCSTSSASACWIPLAWIDAAWSLKAKASTNAGVTVLSGERTFPTIYLGGYPVRTVDGLTSVDPGTKYLGSIGNTTGASTSSDAAVTPDAGTYNVTLEQSKYSGTTPTDCYGSFASDVSYTTAAWLPSSTSRCWSSATAKNSIDSGGTMEFRYTNMTYVGAALAGRSVAGPTFDFDFQIFKLTTSKGNTISTAVSPLVHVQIAFGQISLGQNSTDW